MTTIQPKLWTPGDWDAFLGFETNILVNFRYYFRHGGAYPYSAICL
jgi:hypothetical protein